MFAFKSALENKKKKVCFQRATLNLVLYAKADCLTPPFIVVLENTV